MIDPAKCTDFNRTDDQLWEFLLFCVFVANKPAFRTARLLHQFLGESPPLLHLRQLVEGDRLLEALKEVRCGQYGRIAACIVGLVNRQLDLRTATVDELMTIPGIGPKTARYFILHTRPDANVAVLDTHILKELRAQGVRGVPKTTPSSRKLYLRLERKVLEFAARSGLTPAYYDLLVWSKYAKAPTESAETAAA